MIFAMPIDLTVYGSQHALSINEKRKEIEKDDLINFAKAMNIKKSANIISEINAKVQNWNSYADEVNVNKKQRDSIRETLLNFEK